jgi:hypothetical protein
MKYKKTETQTEPEQPVRKLPAVNMDDELLSPVISDAPVATPDAEQSNAPAGMPAGVYMTPKDIAEIVNQAVFAATSAVNQAGGQAIADSIAKALSQHMGPRQKTVAEIGEPKTPFNPTGAKRELLKEFFQNGAPISERYVSDAEIDMLHQITPGSYGTPELPVAVVEKKRLNGKSRMFIIHSDTRDDRLRMKNYAPSFHALLVKLVQEAKDQKAARRAEARALLADD